MLVYALDYTVLDLWVMAKAVPYTLNYQCEFTSKLIFSEAYLTPDHWRKIWFFLIPPQCVNFPAFSLILHQLNAFGKVPLH